MRRAAAVALVLAGVLAAQGVMLDVPLVRQPREGCGAACLTMMVRYWRGGDAGEGPEAIQRALYDRRQRGIPGSAMRRYLEEAGFAAFVIRGTWEDLRRELAGGRPVVVSVAVRGGRLHYVVVTGLDEARGVVRVNDPARRHGFTLSRDKFERQWAGADYWTLAASPADGG
jgi:predicted double-glycine peptidase